MLKNYLITSLTSCENLKLIKARVFNPDLALLFIPLCERQRQRLKQNGRSDQNSRFRCQMKDDAAVAIISWCYHADCTLTRAQGLNWRSEMRKERNSYFCSHFPIQHCVWHDRKVHAKTLGTSQMSITNINLLPDAKQSTLLATMREMRSHHRHDQFGLQ